MAAPRPAARALSLATDALYRRTVTDRLWRTERRGSRGIRRYCDQSESYGRDGAATRTLPQYDHHRSGYTTAAAAVVGYQDYRTRASVLPLSRGTDATGPPSTANTGQTNCRRRRRDNGALRDLRIRFPARLFFCYVFPSVFLRRLFPSWSRDRVAPYAAAPTRFRAFRSVSRHFVLFVYVFF